MVCTVQFEFVLGDCARASDLTSHVCWYLNAGELITLMFPVDNTLPADEGPPYPVNPEIYKYARVILAVANTLWLCSV